MNEPKPIEALLYSLECPRHDCQATRARVSEYGERISALTALCTRAVVEGWTETQVAAEILRLSHGSTAQRTGDV